MRVLISFFSLLAGGRPAFEQLIHGNAKGLRVRSEKLRISSAQEL
jgi:hypothetical protein